MSEQVFYGELPGVGMCFTWVLTLRKAVLGCSCLIPPCSDLQSSSSLKLCLLSTISPVHFNEATQTVLYGQNWLWKCLYPSLPYVTHGLWCLLSLSTLIRVLENLIFVKSLLVFITAILSLLNLNESYDPIHHPADVNRNITASPEDFGLSWGLEEHQVALCLQLRRILLAATGYLVVTLCRQGSVVYIFSSLPSGLAPQSCF